MAAVTDKRKRSEADDPSSPVLRFDAGQPLRLDAGTLLSPFQLAYQTYGELNAARSNAILICHALTGDQHVANQHPVTGKPGWWEVLIGPGAQLAAAPYFATEALRLTSVHGRTQPIAPYRVLAAAAGSRFEVSEQRGLTEYVGRAQALAELCAAWDDARAGRGRLVSIEGPAGIGKTRLLHELARLARAGAPALRVLHGRCQDFGNVPPYQPFVEALRAVELARCALSEPARDALRCLLEPGSLPERFQDAAGERLRDAIGAALFELCDALAREAPLLLVFEDWHLADEPSRVALRHIAQGIERCSALIAVDCRPGEIGNSLRALSSWHEQLEPLDAQQTAQIAQGALQVAALPPGVARHVYERSLGNPFFAEEIARSLLEGGALARVSGSLVLVRPLAQGETPQTVQAVVRARVDRLPREIGLLASLMDNSLSSVPTSLPRTATSPCPALDMSCSSVLICESSSRKSRSTMSFLSMRRGARSRQPNLIAALRIVGGLTCSRSAIARTVSGPRCRISSRSSTTPPAAPWSTAPSTHSHA